MVCVIFFVKSINLRLLLAGKKLTGYFTQLLCWEDQCFFLVYFLEIERSIMCMYNLLSLLCTSVTRQGNLHDLELERAQHNSCLETQF